MDLSLAIIYFLVVVVFTPISTLGFDVVFTLLLRQRQINCFSSQTQYPCLQRVVLLKSWQSEYDLQMQDLPSH